MNRLRRKFLKKTGAAGILAFVAASMWLRPGQALAGGRNRAPFLATSTSDALEKLGIAGAIESRDIRIIAPDIAENGAVVELEIESGIPGTTSLLVFIDKNQNPLVAEYIFSDGALPMIQTYVKMAATSAIRVIAKADGALYTASREVQVTLGGCG